MGLYPDQEGCEGSHNGGVEVPVVPGKVLYCLELNVLAHQVHSIPAVTVTCTESERSTRIGELHQIWTLNGTSKGDSE